MCLSAKNVEIGSGYSLPMYVCQGCPALVAIQSENAAWHTFLRAIFSYLHIDQMLSPEELAQTMATLKNKADLDAFLGSVANKEEKEEMPPCPHCSLDLQTLLSTGRIGCAHCYKHFHLVIKSMSQQVQNQAVQHIGKTPKACMVEADVADLEKEMSLAIKEERYEEAAKLRDQIKALRSSTTPPSSADQ